MAKRSSEERETEDEEEEEEEEEEVETEEEQEARKKKIVISNSVVKSSAGNQNQQQTLSCQVDDCEADLGVEKRYHQRHKVCEKHAKAVVVLVGGVEQRYCQQCSRFHEISQFDDTKRSCRKRLADHNQRRRKIPADQQADDPGRVPAVLKLKDSSCKPKPRTGGTNKTQVIKIALPRNPNTKHFQIK